jgi:hypothetical protein
VISLAQVRALLGEIATEWQDLRFESLQFWHRDATTLTLAGLAALAIVVLAARSAIRRKPGRHHIVLPALLASAPRSGIRWVAHAPFVLALAGLPVLALALADPHTPLVGQDVSFPGRRISIMIDASTSMHALFTAKTLNTRSATDKAFFTTVAAAERFVRLRLAGKYRDLLALVEFGNQAYVITPFTSDYDNILLSISLISDPVEFSRFPDQGTVIAQAIEQSIELFRAFDFLEASGNLMVIFTDGEDTKAIVHGRSLDDILESAIEHKIPLYFVRTSYDRGLGDLIPDALWRSAVEKTGGRFYAAKDEDSLLRAIHDIDAAAAGSVRIRQYSSQEPRFSFFAAVAAALWASAAALKMVVPYFQKLP